MRIFVPTPPVSIPVSRDTFAPWLHKRSTKIMLVRDWEIWVRDERFVVPSGYITDWSSIPRYMWIIYPPNFSEARQAALLHDYIYSHLWPIYTKKFADVAFKHIMLHDKARRSTAGLFYYSVKFGGGGGWGKFRNKSAHPFWRHQYEKLTQT